MASGADQASGAASGAMAGAAAGAPLGPYGALAGGVIGGGLGWWNSRSGGDKKPDWEPDRNNYNLPGYGDMQSQYGGLLGQGPRGAPQAGQSGFRGDQRSLIDALRAQSEGRGAGQEIARQQAGQMTDRGLGQQLAMARSSRPGQSAMGARNAAMASGQLQGAGAQAATMGGLQAQQSAFGQLGGAIQGARGQDLQRNLGNAQLQYQTMGLDDARQMELLRQQLAMNQSQQKGGWQYEGDQGSKYGYGMAQNKPSSYERLMGSAQGLGQAYLQYQAGQNGGGGMGKQQDFGGTPKV